MKILTSADVAGAAPPALWVEALRQGFAQGIAAPARHHHKPTAEAILLLMPAWSNDWTGIKTTIVKPGNPALGLPAVQASYQLIDNETGATAAVMDGTELTLRRTAAASALAADYLARPDAATLLIVGAGALSPHFVRAHRAVRPLSRVMIWNRSPDKADALASKLCAEGIDAASCNDLEKAAAQADIISCVTSSAESLIKGAWLKPGTHVDLAGAFTPVMRETDAEVIARSRVFVDTHEGAAAEAGDLLQARDEGRFDFASIQGDLAQLCRGQVKGRSSADEITLFKSCGTAVEDLAAAIMVYLRHR